MIGDRSPGSERIVATLSTLVAVAILAAGVTASQNQSSSTSQSNVAVWESDLRFQVKSVFRHDMRERDARMAKIDAVMQAWRQSPQGEADREMLVDWLTDSTARSIPGAVAELPPVPAFGTPRSARGAAPGVADHDSSASSSPPAVANAERESEGALPASDFIAPKLVVKQNSHDEPVTPTSQVGSPPAGTSLAQPPTVDPKLRAVSTGSPSPLLAPVPNPADSPIVREPSAMPVQVNLTELAARIAGYHDALDELELALLRSDAPDLHQLSEQLTRLEAVTRNYDFVSLYYGTLSEQERETMLAPRSPQAALGEVTRQLDQLAEQSHGDFLDSFDDVASRQVETLREQLSSIRQRVPRR